MTYTDTRRLWLLSEPEDQEADGGGAQSGTSAQGSSGEGTAMTALAALLDRDAYERPDGFFGAAADLPARLWEQALLSPARDFLQRPGKAFRGRLVSLCSALAGGNPSKLPEELPLVVELIHAGSLIIDDIQDQSESRRGRPVLHQLYGVPLAINTGNWFYFWSLAVLERNLPSHRLGPVQASAVRTLMRCHQGQALDLSVRVFELSQDEVARAVAASTGLKTGALMEFAAFLGASAADADERVCRLLARFGYQLGLGLQMLDDLGGLCSESRSNKGAEDLRMARLTWPWVWLAESASERVFAELQGRVRQLAASASHGDSAGSGALPGLAELRADLADRVAERGRERVSAALGGALGELRNELGSSMHLSMLEKEVQRLERSYG